MRVTISGIELGGLLALVLGGADESPRAEYTVTTVKKRAECHWGWPAQRLP